MKYPALMIRKFPWFVYTFTIKNINPVLADLDPIVLNSLYQITSISKSAALALTLIYQGDNMDKEGIERLSLNDAVNISRVDE